jgi:ribonuclease P protein component
VTPGPTGRPRRPGVGPVRSRETFADLRRNSSRGRSGPVSVSFVDRPEWDRPQVAYAVNRKVGNAVQRNLLRRRMRAIVSEQAAGLPAGAYLLRSNPTGPTLEFNELKVAMSQALEKATSRAPSQAGR